ncbi:MAG TPA: PfkB family carbohydrate kinase [Chloroflexia bacterium]|nr:PfkB family carbohydrate kinase [Chloroflexia bacterium]
MNNTERRPDYLVVGHVTKDLLPGGQGVTAGGTASYSALTAQRLGLRAAIVTACAREDDYLLDEARQAGIWVCSIEAPHTTTFRNIYDGRGHRTQIIGAQASPIAYGDIPEAWRGAAIVHLGPVAQELDENMPRLFRECLLGITPQGWLRSWDGEGRVTHSAWPITAALRDLPKNAFLVLSIEDLDYAPRLVDAYVKLAPQVAITEGAGEATIYSNGRVVKVPAYRSASIDPTGAGDVFATALFVRYKETGDPAVATRFAHAAAAIAIEGPGTSAIPDRAGVEGRMRDVLRTT